MIQKTVFFCFALFLISFSQAQVEVNVKLSPGYNDLQAFLASQSGQINPIESVPATLSSRFPFVNNLNQVTALRLNESLEDIFTLSLNESNTQITITTLKQSGAFEFVEENHIRSLHQLNYQPNDDSLTKQWFHNYIQTPQAWDLTTGSASVKIGFLDT
ncbi:MAG: hypothetical protein KDE26_13980, partial [Bacteroidetes bacterium]|nr:hypothetical protein [Bacteroidota bacterium]